MSTVLDACIMFLLILYGRDPYKMSTVLDTEESSCLSASVLALCKMSTVLDQRLVFNLKTLHNIPVRKNTPTTYCVNIFTEIQEDKLIY